MKCFIHNREDCGCHQSRVADIRCKQVINICDGCCLGFPSDVLIDMEIGRLVAIMVPGPAKYWGLFGRKHDFIIPWDCIKRIGGDTVLVELNEHKHCHPRVRRGFFSM
jgi:YlmC/YmxH family sporulation protein